MSHPKFPSQGSAAAATYPEAASAPPWANDAENDSSDENADGTGLSADSAATLVDKSVIYDDTFGANPFSI